MPPLDHEFLQRLPCFDARDAEVGPESVKESIGYGGYIKRSTVPDA